MYIFLIKSITAKAGTVCELRGSALSWSHVSGQNGLVNSALLRLGPALISQGSLSSRQRQTLATKEPCCSELSSVEVT